MSQHDFKRGDVVRVRGFQGVACWYVGPQIEPGPSEYECPECDGRGWRDCADCGGDGGDHDCAACDGSGEESCEFCAGGVCYDEEPVPIATGRALVVMVGDDHKHVVDFEDMAPLEREAYCGACGQIGCAHDGLTREEGDA